MEPVPSPGLGFGTLIPDPVATMVATKAALEAGFRLLGHIGYATEPINEVGEAMQESVHGRKGKREDVGRSSRSSGIPITEPCRVKPSNRGKSQETPLAFSDRSLPHSPCCVHPEMILDSGMLTVW